MLLCWCFLLVISFILMRNWVVLGSFWYTLKWLKKIIPYPCPTRFILEFAMGTYILLILFSIVTERCLFLLLENIIHDYIGRDFQYLNIGNCLKFEELDVFTWLDITQWYTINMYVSVIKAVLFKNKTIRQSCVSVLRGRSFCYIHPLT